MQKINKMENFRNTTFRIEKTVFSRKNLEILCNLTGDNIVIALLMYIFFQHQYDILGYGIIVPDDFMNLMGYSRAYIRSIPDHKEEDANQLPSVQTNSEICSRQTLKSQLESLPKNRIERGLFALTNSTLFIQTTTINTDRYLMRRVQSTKILKEYSCLREKTTGITKYCYLVDEDVRRNLNTFYNKVNLNSTIQLRKSPNLLQLYLFLVRLKDALYAKNMTKTPLKEAPSFDYLCEISGINTTAEKRYQKRDLCEAFAKIKERTELDFTVTWEKNSNGHRYIPMIQFHPTEEENNIINSERVGSIDKKKEKIDVAATELTHQLLQIWHNSTKDTEQDSFAHWLQNDDQTIISDITKCLEDTLINIGCKCLKSSSDIVHQLIAKLRALDNLQDLKKLVLDYIFVHPEILVSEKIVKDTKV